MNELTKFLVESVIGTEFDKPKTSVALFGGGFKPPTKGHLEVVNQGIKQNPEVSKVKILVGGGERNGFTQDQAVKIWNLYNDIGLPTLLIGFHRFLGLDRGTHVHLVLFQFSKFWVPLPFPPLPPPLLA